MATQVDAPRPRPGLSDRERKILDRLEKQAAITDFQRGQLRAYAYFGHEEDARKAERILAKHGKGRG